MRFEPFIAVPLSLLVAACSSSKFNSLMEARSAAWEWEGQGDQITISWTTRVQKTKYKTVTRTDEELERERELKRKAVSEYAEDLSAKRDAWTKNQISKMRVSEGFLDSPNLKNTREWRQTRYFGYVYEANPCKETSQIVCVTEEKIASSVTPRTRQVPKTVFEDVEEKITFVQRDCTHEEETSQFVCWSVSGQQFNVKDEKEAKALKASIQGNKKYRYFRY